MSRKKLSEEDKKRKFSISIDDKLYSLLEKYMVDNDIRNRSRYIEYLVRNDMKNRGEDVDKF